MRSPAESYGSIDNINKVGNFTAPEEMVLQEKIDGSQFRFQEQWEEDGGSRLVCWSRGQRLNNAAPPNLFAPAVATAQKLWREKLLIPGAVYVAEAMASKRHNVINYGRAPVGGMVLFDVFQGPSLGYASPELVKCIGERLGLEVAPYHGSITAGGAVYGKTLEEKASVAESLLGGPIEGFVLKGRAATDRGGGLLKFKVINPAYGETKRMPKTPREDWLLSFGSELATPMLWGKAVLRLKEAGALTDTSKDIGAVIRSVIADIDKEHTEALSAVLWGRFRKTAYSNAINGLAQWYQARLVDEMLAEPELQEVAA